MSELSILSQLGLEWVELDSAGSVVRSSFGMEGGSEQLRTSTELNKALELPLRPFVIEENFSFLHGQRARCRGRQADPDRFVLVFEPVAEPTPTPTRPLLNRIRELEFIIHHLRQGIWRLGPDGTILEVNPFMAEWLETSPGRLLGQKAQEYRREDLTNLDAARAGRYEAEFITASGQVRRAIVTHASVLGPRQELLGSVELVTDMTAEHALRRQLVQEVNRMQSLAHLDPLTQVGNRRAFDLALSKAESGSDRNFGVILVDLDDLKQINDSLGHEAGDQAILAFTQLLKDSVRPDDLVARLGGDEFCILVQGVRPEELDAMGERMQAKLRVRVAVEGSDVELSASVGWAHRSQTERLLNSADAKMYRTKRRGQKGHPELL
ncbi:MAG TPA: diguanylate cyclase [Fimbriimonadaceae bacterium]|nr:diguanylate cyclase [Fimbriimonadaceae bacterium]HRJ32619.1 diguanylate cyclase [Fimbriimonadaceae bacterium]